LSALHNRKGAAWPEEVVNISKQEFGGKRGETLVKIYVEKKFILPPVSPISATGRKTVQKFNTQFAMILMSAAVVMPLAAAGNAESNAEGNLATKNAVAWSSGALKVDGVDFVGSANVQAGQAVETRRASGQLYLSNGSRLRLGAETKVKVGANDINLESGVARVDAVAAGEESLPIRAGHLEIRAKAGVIQRSSPTDVIVSAAASPMEVRNPEGVLLAMVNPGQSLAFGFAQATASAKIVELQGQLQKVKDQFRFFETTTKRYYELKFRSQQIDSYAKMAKKLVRVQGTIANASAKYPVINVTSISPLAGAAGAAGATGATVAGLSSKTVVAGVVITSAAVTGTTLALVSNNQEDPISPQ
jgi:hypothetical protein